jgi:hypothetical protein
MPLLRCGAIVGIWLVEHDSIGMWQDRANQRSAHAGKCLTLPGLLLCRFNSLPERQQVTVSVARVQRAFQAQFLYVPGTDMASEVVVNASSAAHLTNKFVGQHSWQYQQAALFSPGWRSASACISALLKRCMMSSPCRHARVQGLTAACARRHQHDGQLQSGAVLYRC